MNRVKTEEELRKIFADKLSGYRKLKGMTQLELAEKLNYSDKSISKWERGEGLPDLYVVTLIAELFGVTVNDMLTAGPIRRPFFTRNKLLTTLMALAVPWLLATVLCTLFAMALPSFPGWVFFIFAVPITAIVAIVFTCVWWTKPLQFLSVSALIWTLPTSFVVTVNLNGMGLIYTISAVLQVLTILWYLRKKQ